MKALKFFSFLLPAVFLFSCSNSDEQIQKELEPALVAAQSKLDAWCKCVDESASVNECIEPGKAFNEERTKYMELLDKKGQEHGRDNKVLLKYVGGNQDLGVRQTTCNGKFLERGGEKWW